MSNEEAKSLFLSKLEGEEENIDEAQMRDLLKELGQFPLAVSQAAAFIKENGVSIIDYAKYTPGTRGRGIPR